MRSRLRIVSALSDMPAPTLSSPSSFLASERLTPDGGPRCGYLLRGLHVAVMVHVLDAQARGRDKEVHHVLTSRKNCSCHVSAGRTSQDH
jgi:hypothetical protein